MAVIVMLEFPKGFNSLAIAQGILSTYRQLIYVEHLYAHPIVTATNY